MCSLLSNVGLLLEVNIAERVVLKNVRGAYDVEWENVKLVFARGPKTQHPEFRLNLPSFQGRQEFRWLVMSVGGVGGNCAVAIGTRRVTIQRVNL